MTQQPETIQVDLGERSYDIVIGEGIVHRAGEYIANVANRKRVFVVTDENVAALHLKTLGESLKAGGMECHAIVLPAGESTKCFAELERLLHQLFEHTPERKDMLIAFGGGVIGDITGFAASMLLRGVDFVQIPTTLLAQVDSSVGGKTGVNNRFGKNLVGSFYQPKLVLADMALLHTLPKREFLAGYAEVLKYALINDPEFFDWLDKNRDAIAAQQSDVLIQAVKKSCQAKADIVSRDEREGGVRALLNLGHTFGHALEKDMGYSGKLLHGEAVAIGMVMAFAFSVRQGLCEQKDVDALVAHMKAVGLPVCPFEIKKEWDARQLVGYMAQDKKVSDGKLVFILARGIGRSFVAKDIKKDDVERFMIDAIHE